MAVSVFSATHFFEPLFYNGNAQTGVHPNRAPFTNPMPTSEPVSLQDVVATIEEIGKIKSLAPQQDFYDAGMSSVASLTLLIELESRFGVSLPDDKFMECRTPAQVAELITSLQAAA